MRERKYSRYRKEKRIALTILGVLAVAVLAFVLVFSLTAKKDGNPLSSLTPEINGSLDMNTGSSISGNASSDLNYALSSNLITEVGSVPSGYNNTRGTLFTTAVYQSDFSTFTATATGTANATITDTEKTIDTNYYMNSDVTIDWHYFGSNDEFTGTFDGNGHTITISGISTGYSNYNWNNKFVGTTDSGNKMYVRDANTGNSNKQVNKPSKAGTIDYNSDFQSFGLFGKSIGSSSESGTIKNLKIVLDHTGTDGIEMNCAKNAAFGILTGWLRRGTVENVKIVVNSGTTIYVDNTVNGTKKDSAIGLFAGIAGNTNSTDVAKLYNVESEINGTFTFKSNSGNSHVGFGGIVGHASNIDMKGAKVSGNGTIQMTGTGGWRMAGGFIGMCRAGFGSDGGLKDPTSSRLAINNLIMEYSGSWSAVANGGSDNCLNAFVGSFGTANSPNSGSAIKVYTPYTGSGTNIKNKASSNSAEVSATDTTNVYATFQCAMTTPFTYVNIRGEGNLKLLHEMGATSSTVIVTPKVEGVYSGVTGVSDASFNSAGQYADLSSVAAGQYTVGWKEKASLPTYSLGWLTDFGKIPYGYNGIPDDATAIGSQNDLNNWMGSGSTYGYLTDNFTVSENWWSNTAYKTLGEGRVLDGAGHTITVSPHTAWTVRSGADQVSLYGRTTLLAGYLFHYNKGTIKNLTVQASSAGKENNGNSDKSMLGGMVVGINNPTGRIENVNVYLKTTWNFECDATSNVRYSVFGGVVGVNEGYVGYSGFTNDGTITTNTAKHAGASTSNLTITGGVIGVNLGKAEYLTSYGTGTFHLISRKGKDCFGSIVGVSCKYDDSVFTVNGTKTFDASSGTGTLNYAFSGFTGTLKNDNFVDGSSTITTEVSSTYAGSVAGYVSGASKGINWAVISGSGTYTLTTNSTSTFERKANERVAIGSSNSSVVGGNIRVSDSRAGAIHGYYDYFYNDGALNIEFENPADIETLSCNNSNVQILDALKEVAIPKSVLDESNNIIITTEIYSKANAPTNPYADLNVNSTDNNIALKSIALASSVEDGFRPAYVSGMTHSVKITNSLSLPLTGGTAYYLETDVTLTAPKTRSENDIKTSFSGSIDGQGHTLTINLNDCTVGHSDISNAGLGGILSVYMENAKICNIHIKFVGNATFKSSAGYVGNYGLLAGKALGSTTIENAFIEFASSGTVNFQMTYGNNWKYFGGLFGCLGGSTIIKNSIIRSNGVTFKVTENSTASFLGLISGRVAPSDTTAGYENLILAGGGSLNVANGDKKIATIFGSVLSGNDTPNNSYANNIKRKNIHLYNFTVSSANTELCGLWGQTDNSTPSNTSIYKYNNAASNNLQNRCIINNNGSERTTNTGVSNVNRLTTDSFATHSSGSIDNWQNRDPNIDQGITKYRTQLSNYNNLNSATNLDKVTATIVVDGKTISSSSNSEMLKMYLSKGKQLYGSSSSYAYRGFVRYGAQDEPNARYYSSASSPSLYGTNTNMGSVTLQAQLTIFAYSAQPFGKSLDDPDGYETVYAKFNKLREAYDAASGDDKAFYKAMLERSAGVDGLGILTVALPEASTYSFTKDTADATKGTGTHWLSPRVSITTQTSKTAYIFRTNSGLTYRLDITPSFIDIKGLITEYSPTADLASAHDTVKASLSRTVSNGGASADYANTLPRGQAVLFGISDGEAVYFGQSAGGYNVEVIVKNNTAPTVYDNLDGAKAKFGLTSQTAASGHFKITGVGSTKESNGKTYVSFENCGYAVVVDGTLVQYSSADDGTITVGSATSTTAAIFRYQAKANEFVYTGEVSDNTKADGWTAFDSSTMSNNLVQGSYVPKTTSTIRNFKLSFSDWSETGVCKELTNNDKKSGPRACNVETAYGFGDFGVSGATDFGKFIRYTGDTNTGNTVRVVIATISINGSAVDVSLQYNDGTVTSKYYDGYAGIDKIKNVKLLAGTQVSLNYTADNSSLRNVNSAHRDNLADEILRGGNGYTATFGLKGATQTYDQTTSVLDAGNYMYTALFSFKSDDVYGYVINAELYNQKEYTDYDQFVVHPLPLSFTYTPKGTNLNETYTGSRIDFVSATANLSSAAEDLIREQYATEADKNAAVSALNTAIGNISANQIGIRYIYAADANGVNTMFDSEYRRGVTYASKTTTAGGNTVVAESGPINAGTYYFSGYIVGTPNFIGLTNDYKELIENAGMTFNVAYFQSMAASLKTFSTRGWAVNLDANNGYADAFNFANYQGADSLNSAFEHYYDLLTRYSSELFEQSSKETRTVAISRATVSVYVKDSAIEYGSVDKLSLNNETQTRGPVVENADYVITDSRLSPAVTIRIKPEAFTFDGTTYDYLPVKLANPNNPESSVTSYRNALYIDTNVDTGNPNLIISAVDGNLTIVRKEITVSWAYDTSDSTYQTTSGVYHYQEGVKHTMIPSYDGIINNDALDFDIIDDGDMETVGVHKIIVAFSSRYTLDSYNYYFGESATGYMTVAPKNIAVTFRYYQAGNRESEYSAAALKYTDMKSETTLNIALTVTVGSVNYYSSDGKVWTSTSGGSNLDLTKYPADKWISEIKSNLHYNQGSSYYEVTWNSASSSWGTLKLKPQNAGSEYTVGIEMDGFVMGDFSFDMHDVNRVLVRRDGAKNEISQTVYSGNSADDIRYHNTETIIDLTTSPSEVNAKNVAFHDDGSFDSVSLNNNSYKEFSTDNYKKVGYLFDGGDLAKGMLGSTNSDEYNGLFYKESGDTSTLANFSGGTASWSRYSGFESVIYCASAYGSKGWQRGNIYGLSSDVYQNMDVVLIYFNVNISNALTSAIARNGGINVSIGGNAISGGNSEYYNGMFYAGPMTAGIAVNDYGNRGMQTFTRKEINSVYGTGTWGNYSATWTPTSLGTKIYGVSSVTANYRENTLYNGLGGQRACDDNNQKNQSYIFAANADKDNNNKLYDSNGNEYNGSDPVVLARKTMVSSANSGGTSVLKGDSFRINLYALANNLANPNGSGPNGFSSNWGRGVMAQFGNIKIALSKVDSTAPSVTAPLKQGNGYRFTVTDAVGVDTASVSLNLVGGKNLTIANGGLKVVARNFTNSLVTSVTFETTSNEIGMTIGADTSEINKIVSVTASDIRYAGGQNTATYGFNSNGNWVEKTGSVTLKEKDTQFVDVIGPAINITHVGLDNYADGDDRWVTFAADNADEQKRAKKFITATWRQQNYLWLKFSAGTGKIPSDEALSRIAVYDNGDFTVTPIFEEAYTSNYPSVYNVPAIRLEANTRYYLIAEDKYGNRSEVTLYFSMVDTADASALSIVADPVELDDNNLKPYDGSAIVNGGAFTNWSPLGAEQLFANTDNPRFGLDMESDGVYNYSVMLVRFNDGKIRVALRVFVDGKISYVCGTREFTSESLSYTYNAATGSGEISQWLLDSGFGKLVIDNAQTVTLYDTGNQVVATSTPMVINTEDYNSYIEDTWSNTSVIMRLVGSGESNSLARFYYRYAPDPTNPDAPNTATNDDETSNPHLFRNYGWIALPVVIDDNGNVIVDQTRSLLFEHTGIYRFEVKIELGAGQNSYLVYRDSFGNWVYNAYAEGENVRAYKVEPTHYTTYNPTAPENPKGGKEFNEATEIGYYTVKIDKRIYFLELKNYWYDQEDSDNPIEDYDPNVSNVNAKNTSFADIDILKWNKDDQDYTTALKKQTSGEYVGAYNVGSSSASNRNTWVRLDIRSHIQDVGTDEDMWYAVHKILADVYVGDELISAGVDLPLGSETNRFEVGSDGIAIRRLRELAINMPEVTSSLENIKLVYRVYYKYYFSFVIDYQASYASYYGSDPKGEFVVPVDGENSRVTPISGKLREGYKLGDITLQPVELTASDGTTVNFNYSSFAILDYNEETGVYSTGGFTVTRTNDRGIAITENIVNTPEKTCIAPVSSITPAGKHFYAISGTTVATQNGISSGDYLLMFQRSALRKEGEEKISASMTATQVQFASQKKPYTFNGFALGETNNDNPVYSDDNKVNSVIVNGTEYFVKIVNDTDSNTFAELYANAEFDGARVGTMAIGAYDTFMINEEVFKLGQLMVYDDEGHEIGEFGRTLTIEGKIYQRSTSDPYYTVEKAFVNVSKGGNFLKLYDGTNNYLGGSATDGWNTNEYAIYDDTNDLWKPGKAIGTAPESGLTAVEIAGYYVGSDDEPQANVSRATDVTYLKMFLPADSNYRFATVGTKHTVEVRNGLSQIVSDGSPIGNQGLTALYKTVYAEDGVNEIIGHDAPVSAGVKVSTTVNWSSIMIPDTSYANAKPNRIDGETLSSTSSISTILARPVAAKSEVQNNDVVNVTFNGAAQGGSAIRIIEDATTINDATGYGTLPSETVVFAISEGNSVTSPILAGSYNFSSVTPDSSSIGIANVETAFGAANVDSIANNYYVDSVTGAQNVNFKLIINTLENSFALNRVVKSDGSGYELRITLANLKQTKDALDFLGVATSDDTGVAESRYLTDGEFSQIKDMIAAGGKFEGENALGVGDNLKDADEYYALIESGTQLLLDVTDTSVLSDNEKRLLELHAKLSQVLEYRFQCALGKVFRSANNGSDNFYANMPDFREGRFSDWKFDENTGTFTMVFKGNVNLDTVFFSDRYSMRVSGLADLIKPDTKANDDATYSTNSWTSDSSLADGQIERYDYVEAAVNSATVTYISTQQELKDWLSMTDSSEAGYANGVLIDNIFEFNWGYANGLGGALVGLAQGRTLNGNGYAIGITGAEFNNAGNLNMRLVTKDNLTHYATAAVTTKRWSAGGAFLQYVDGTIENTNFVYRSTRKYDISDIYDANNHGANETSNAYGLSVGIISGFAGSTASFRNVSLDIKGQFYVDYIGTQLLREAYIGVGGFAGYADNIASFEDCTVNYYYVPGKTLDNGYTTDRYTVSATISSASAYGMHLGWGGFAGITGGNGTAQRLTVTTQVDAEYVKDVTNVYAIYIGRNTNYAAWTKAAGMFGFTTRTAPAGSSGKVSGRIDGIINKFSGRIAGYLKSSGETDFGSLAGEVGGAALFTNIYTYGTAVSGGKLVGSTKSDLPLIGTGTNMSSSIVHDRYLSIYQGDEGLVDYYFGGNRYDYYEEDGVKYFYQTTKFINGNAVVYSPFDDYTNVGGVLKSGWTGWKLADNGDGSYKVFRDYDRNVEIGSVRFTNAEKTEGSFTLRTTVEGEESTATYTFNADGVTNESGDTVVGMTVDAQMMTISDQNNTYYFSVPVARSETDSPRKNNGINIEVLAPAQSYVWEYHSTFYANNLGKTSAVSRIVWNLDQVGGKFDDGSTNSNYKQNNNGFVISGKNEDAAYNHIDGVNWFTPALGQFQTMSADSDGTIFQFVYDGQNHNNNISVTVTINGSKQTISADASVDMIDAGVYVVGTFDLGADTTYEGSSGYIFDTTNRKGQSRNVTSPQLMVVIYPRVLKLEGGVAKQYDGTTVYEHVIETEEDGMVNDFAAGTFNGILADDKNGGVIILGDFDDATANEDKSIGFAKQSKREVPVYTENGTVFFLTVRRGQDRKPIIGESGYPELTTVMYSFGNGNGYFDTDDDIPFNDADSVVAFYAAIGQIDSVDEVRKAFAEANPDAEAAEIEAAILAAYNKFDADATEMASVEIYNFEARAGGKNSSGEAGTDADEFFVNKTDNTVITKTEYGQLATDAERENYEFLSDYVYIAAILSGDRGFNYALAADGIKVPLTGGKVGGTFTTATFDKDAIGNEYVKITPREIDVWFNGLFQSFYNDDADENYDYKAALEGVAVTTLRDADGNELADDATDAEKAAAVRLLFADLPSVLTDEEVLALYEEIKELTVTFTVTDAQNAEIIKAFEDNEVGQFEIGADVGGANFAVNNGDESKVKNKTNPVLTVCHYNGKVGEDGLPYVGGEESGEQFMSLTNRRDVLNLNYSGMVNGEAFDYSGFNFYLENDIDMNSATTLGINWSKSAAVTFDGGNHAITNFTVAQNASGGEAGGITIGFFLTVSEGSTVKNLILADAEIIVYGQSRFDGNSTITRVGGIAGSNGGLIENVVFEGTIKRFPGDGNESGREIGNGILGGIVGSNGGTIRRALSLANIETTAESADVRVGGLAGVNVGTIGEDCYVVGKSGMVHGDGCTVGSVVGQNFFESDGQTFDGRFVDADGAETDESIVLDMSTDAGAYSATTAALGFADHKVEEIVRTYCLKDKLYGRPTDADNDAPYGSAANPVKISNFRQLEMALNLPYFFYEITEDIVFNTGFDEVKLDKVIGSGYGYGRVKIANGTKIVLRYNQGAEVSIVAGASGVTVNNFSNGTVETPYVKDGAKLTFAEMVDTFFTVG